MIFAKIYLGSCVFLGLIVNGPAFTVGRGVDWQYSLLKQASAMLLAPWMLDHLTSKTF